LKADEEASAEFEMKHNSAIVHAQLTKRERQSNETPMYADDNELNDEEEALNISIYSQYIQYIIDEVSDGKPQKHPLRNRHHDAIKKKFGAL